VTDRDSSELLPSLLFDYRDPIVNYGSLDVIYLISKDML
jgi:hypothetical protein